MTKARVETHVCAWTYVPAWDENGIECPRWCCVKRWSDGQPCHAMTYRDPDLELPGYVHVNGCALCGVLPREHFQRYDGLHPRDNQGYHPPSDALRKQRLIRNRYERIKNER